MTPTEIKYPLHTSLEKCPVYLRKKSLNCNYMPHDETRNAHGMYIPFPKANKAYECNI